MSLSRLPCWPLALALLLALPAAAQDKAPAKKLYCWNEGGRKVCGDALPATAVNGARTEINARSGLPARRVDRALTPAEAAAAQAARKQAEQDAMDAAAAARRDQAMAESYATEADLRRAFNARIVLLDETIKASSLGVDGLRQSLLNLLRRAGDAELAGKPVPKPLASNIASQHAQLNKLRTLLVRQRADRAQVDTELAAALARWREMKSATPSGAPAPVPAAQG